METAQQKIRRSRHIVWTFGGKGFFIDNTSRTHTDVLRLCIGHLRHSIWRMDMIAGKSIYCLAPRRYNHKAK